jgi:hypothetical protein
MPWVRHQLSVEVNYRVYQVDRVDVTFSGRTVEFGQLGVGLDAVEPAPTTANAAVAASTIGVKLARRGRTDRQSGVLKPAG